jgi:hypothetical protein
MNSHMLHKYSGQFKTFTGLCDRNLNVFLSVNTVSKHLIYLSVDIARN